MAAAAAAAHHGDGADLRTGDALAVLRERFRHVRTGAAMAGMLQHHVHEARAPQAAATGRVAAKVTARLGDDVGRAEARRAPSRRRAASGLNYCNRARLRWYRRLRWYLRLRWYRRSRRGPASARRRAPSATHERHGRSADDDGGRNAAHDVRRDRRRAWRPAPWWGRAEAGRGNHCDGDRTQRQREEHEATGGTQTTEA